MSDNPEILISVTEIFAPLLIENSEKFNNQEFRTSQIHNLEPKDQHPQLCSKNELLWPELG